MSMSSYGFGPSDPFGDLLNRFFGMSPASSPSAVQRVPIGRLLTESSQELLNLAARRAQQDGSSDLDTEHLLWAATKVEPARSLLARAEVRPVGSFLFLGPTGVGKTELAKTLAELLLGGEAEPGDTIVADDRDGSVHCTVRKAASGDGASGDGTDAARGSGKFADATQNE